MFAGLQGSVPFQFCWHAGGCIENLFQTWLGLVWAGLDGVGGGYILYVCRFAGIGALSDVLESDHLYMSHFVGNGYNLCQGFV
jgi:hypothetical protein